MQRRPPSPLLRSFTVLALASAALAGASCSGLPGPDGPRLLAPEDLPVKRVILYQNGVGYFERAGKLRGNVLTLHCRPSQINDLLKSLTVIDRASGRPVSVSLPLEKSGDKVLSELPKQVRGAAGLLDVLRVFRGARVRLHGADGSMTGRVVGVEQGLQATAEAKEGSGTAAWSVTLKDERGDLLVLPVATLRRVELLDRTLEAGLEKSLDVSLEEGSWKSISLAVRLAGPEDHDLLVSYIVEMPQWKPAYRLVLQRERPPLLQGWAVVDNVSGESWRDVSLSLVTGTPMSFVYDLHTPRFTRRPDLSGRGTTVAYAPPEEEAADAPGSASGIGSAGGGKDALQRAYSRRRHAGHGAASDDDGDLDDARTTTKQEAYKRSSGRRPARPAAKLAERHDRHQAPPAGASANIVSREAMNVALERQLERVKTDVKGTKLGSLFRYDLQDPVTVPDSSSTLVNIINARVPGAEVVLFRPELTAGQPASHPYRAVKFKNQSGFALEQGPVTIYSGGTFVGEGFLERMEKGQTLFLTYSIDGTVSMTQSQSWGEEGVRLLKIHRGLIESEVLSVQRATFTISNGHDAPVVAYVRAVRPSREHKLRLPPKDTVDTPEASYVPVTIRARAKAELRVEWVSPTRRWLAIDTSLAGTVLKMYLGAGDVPPGVRPTLEKIIVAKQRLEAVNQELEQISRRKSTLADDQARVRSNLDLLRKVKGNEALKGRLIKSIATLEDQLSKLTARFVKLDEEKAGLLGEMQALIGQITLEAPTPKK